tara:strand:+ start:367 stop:591 length:225 start_codon:yes stop_codon:yes gene_type:complete
MLVAIYHGELWVLQALPGLGRHLSSPQYIPLLGEQIVPWYYALLQEKLPNVFRKLLELRLERFIASLNTHDPAK